MQSEVAGSGNTSVSALEFCATSGLLAVGSENGMVMSPFVYASFMLLLILRGPRCCPEKF